MGSPSFDCKVFEDSREGREHGQGGLWYSWLNESKQFPADVKSVFIMMPYFEKEECNESRNLDRTCDNGTKGCDRIHDDDTRIVPIEWTVSNKNANGAQWTLSGTKEKPTLSPSLNWVGVWHGWLREGRCDSC